MHYYQYNIADYRKDTSHLSLLEHGCYRQLLDQFYLDEKPLPFDEDKLFRLFNARTEDEKTAIKNVLKDFWTKTEDGYVQGRSKTEIELYKDRLETASKSAKKRWDKGSMPTQCQPNANPLLTTNHKPITINQEPLTNINTLGDFDLFWSAYPKKIGKQTAIKVWNKIRPDINVVLKALAWQKESKQWFEQAGRFIPHPSTWLNNHIDDEPPERLTF